MSAPTQVTRPWRATARTVLQVGIPMIIGLGLVVPEIVQIILEESGGAMPASVRAVLLGAAAVVTALAAIITRIMAIPTIEGLLRRHLSGLAADPDAD
ncbi:hypothetical protein ABKW28_19200 [Nocardioides sp. 31GB23]|uniref:hypothetical protein n=1 Tax=Nocardioides sp. 31GB23 TaxID=3156065 RepID=UPI0032AEED07